MIGRRALFYLVPPLCIAAMIFCGRAQADEPCGGLTLQAGQVVLGQPLRVESLNSEDGKRCIAEIAKRLSHDRLVRAVTVAYRVGDTQRTDGKTLGVARAVADALIAAGLPRNRVFAVAPRLEKNEAVNLSIRYAERAPDSVVARISRLSGQVQLGSDAASLRAAELAMPLLLDDLLQTGADGLAVIEMHDGSAIRIARNTQIKMARLSFGEHGDRTVRVEVLRGQIEADVRKAAAGSSFDTSSRIAVASVRGTLFRFDASAPSGSRLETLGGTVTLSSSVNPSSAKVDVRAGHGSLALPSGEVQPPRPLPPTPSVLSPQQGRLPADNTLRFAAVPGATAYRVEIARDADFVIDAMERITQQTQLVLSGEARLAAGRWFFRVVAMDAAGFASIPSKVYAFSVIP